MADRDGTDQTVALSSPEATAAFGAKLSLFFKPGDVIALTGDLGAGKTTLARGMIRALCGDDSLEVPSPSFTLAQHYGSARGSIAHFDFYRLEDAGETVELGLDDAIDDGIVIIEWPEHSASALPADRLEVALEWAGDDIRRARLDAHGSWRARLGRQVAIERFLNRNGWGNARRAHLQGDASARRYERLTDARQGAVLMDAAPSEISTRDKAAGRKAPYAARALLARSTAPFIAMAGWLGACGLSAPEIYAHDGEYGLALLEDLGDEVFAHLAATGMDMDQPYRFATEVLVELACRPPPARAIAVAGAKNYRIPRFTLDAFMAEAELVFEWLWPEIDKTPPPQSIRDEFAAAWQAAYRQLETLPPACALRDFHSPNLLWLPAREGIRRIGLIDFQDAVIAPLGYDLVSLLQDARIDVNDVHAQKFYEQFVSEMKLRNQGFDEKAFAAGYAIWGAQRATKILGIFARLAKRDGKHGYLDHIPRVSAYLERNLAHPALAALAAWYGAHLPGAARDEATGRLKARMS